MCILSIMIVENVVSSRLTKYDKISDIDLASWEELISINKAHLEHLESETLQLIEEKSKKYSTYTPIIPVSMGKDSMLTCYLVRTLYPNTKAIFNNTSLDCPDTYLMVKRFPNCEIMNPNKGLYQFVKEKPSDQ